MAAPKESRRGCGTLEGWGAFLGGIAAIVTMIFTVLGQDKTKEPVVAEQEPPVIQSGDTEPQNYSEYVTKDPILEPEAEDVSEEISAPIKNTPPEPTFSPAPVAIQKPPLVLTDNGNPLGRQDSREIGTMVAIPGFSPGAEEERIKSRLGEPDQKSTKDGFYTTTYAVVPTRVSLAYVYHKDSTRLFQSEAAFAPSVDRLFMRTTLLGMMDGRATDEIAEGLDSVRTGEIDRFDFRRQGFTGFIERNSYDQIYMVVREEN